MCINEKMTWRLNSDPDQQSPILSIGFRPFFLVAGLYAALAMAAWMVWLMLHSVNAVILKPTIAVPAHLWHGHEMLFGYAAAVISGFLLTAVPGWTGARRLAGAALLVLVCVWVLGRLAMWFSSFLPAILVAGIDMLHLPLLAWMVGRALVTRWQPQNAVFLILLIMLSVANGAVHAQWIGWSEGAASWGLVLAVITITLMITILGGRIVPAFTRNAMIRRGCAEHDHPRKVKPIEIASIGSVVALLFCLAMELDSSAAGAIAIFAGIFNLIRQSLWRPMSTISEPILWSLHLAYLWISIGLLSVGSSLLFDVISQSAAMHVLAIGSIGGMTLAMMTRAPLGHTGRPLVVRGSVAIAYLLIAAAAIMRGLLLDSLSSSYFEVMFLAGGLWIGGFAIFVIVYFPILTGPSLKVQAAN